MNIKDLVKVTKLSDSDFKGMKGTLIKKSRSGEWWWVNCEDKQVRWFYSWELEVIK